MTEKGTLRAREIILTIAAVWLFLNGCVSEIALAQSNRNADSTAERLKALETQTRDLSLEMERRTIPLLEQVKSLREEVQAMKESQTFTGRAIIGAIGTFLLGQLLQLIFNVKRGNGAPKETS